MEGGQKEPGRVPVAPRVGQDPEMIVDGLR